MNRRTFLSAVTGGLLAAPLAAEAQLPAKVLRIGYRTHNPLSANSRFHQAFRQRIASIAVAGSPVKFFDHSKKREPLGFSDTAVGAWRTADGYVNLIMCTNIAYRFRGRDLLHLTLDPKKVYDSNATSKKIPEDKFDYDEFVFNPYTLDGVHIYANCHMEWFAALLNGDMTSAPAVNSWCSNVTCMKSNDGGAAWQLNNVGGNHVAIKEAYHWTGTVALSSRSYRYANNMSGLQANSNLLKEGDYYYSMCKILLRDFSVINPSQRIYEAPIIQDGFVPIRSLDFRDPNSWESWTGSGWEPVRNSHYETWYPVYQGVPLNPMLATWFYDMTSEEFVLVFPGTPGEKNGLHGPVFYTTARTLAVPSWGPVRTIIGTDTLVTDPMDKRGDPPGPWYGFTGAFYPVVVDPDSPGYNFEFCPAGRPWLWWSNAPGVYGNPGTNGANRNDMFRVQLQIAYEGQQLSQTLADH